MKNLEERVSTQAKLNIKEKLHLNRKRICEHDFKEFCYAYLPQHFYAKPSLMHNELFKEVQEAIENNIPDNLADAAPRGNAKSTLVSFALVLWASVYAKKHYILILSDTASQSDDFLANVKDELENNEALIEDFGNLVGDVWTQSDIQLISGEVRIQALGASKKIRGRKFKQWRPDLIVVDDLENDENTANLEQRKKLSNWYFKAVSKAGDERTDKIVIGTIIHYDSLLAKLLKNPTYKTKKYQAVLEWSKSPLWDEWERIIVDLENPNRMNDAQVFFDAHKEEMLAGTKVLWEEKENYYNLMLQKVSDGPAAFSSEKQNEPLSDDDRRFNPEWIRYYEPTETDGKELFIVGSCDPSMGKTGGDYSGIITVGEDSNGIIYVLDADIQRRHPDLIITDTISKHREFRYRIFGVEENQFQEYFKDNLKTALENPEFKKLSINIKGVRSHSDKILRIQSLQPDVKNGRIRFKKDQQKLIEQLVNFPFADHDDGPDALEIAVSLLGRRSGILDYIKEQVDESQKNNPISYLQNTNLQRIGV